MQVALALALSLGACSTDTEVLPQDAEAGAAPAASASPLPFVEIPPEARRADLPPLDPDATPRTELGKLRARYLPLWTQDFDLAFPPHTCGTAWELDGIAVPVTGVNVSHYGSPPTMAALAVMRYEHLLATAFANPTPLAQLCIAVAAVDPARAEALTALAPVIGTAPDLAARSGELPQEVILIGASPSRVLAAACVAHASDPHPGLAEDAPMSAASSVFLRTYELTVSLGVEDAAKDISMRVSRVEERQSPDCAALDEWVGEWDQAIRGWMSEGQAWARTDSAVDIEEMCERLASSGDGECRPSWLEQRQ